DVLSGKYKGPCYFGIIPCFVRGCKPKLFDAHRKLCIKLCKQEGFKSGHCSNFFKFQCWCTR
uniref:Antibacterial peptide n=1 Tax=Meloidogyne hapla TaxID=6305 RepID=UPI002888F8C6|nr:Chain A, Antibacterial peptide [Meloidogyne hapla]